MAAVQALGIATGLEGVTSSSGPAVLNRGLFFKFTTVVTLTGGTIFLMWLGEQITARGIGNGISLIIMAGIVANLPIALVSTLELGKTGALSGAFILLILIMAVVVIGFIVYILLFSSSIKYTVDIEIDKPRDTVFALFDDTANMKEYY